MQTLEKNKIQKKFHYFSGKAWFSAQQSKQFDQAEQTQAKKIAKYALRYIDSLTIQHWKDAKLVNALKRVKKISSVQDDKKNSFGNQWRLVLQNKFKSVNFYDPNREQWRFIEKYRVFSKLMKVWLQSDDDKMNTIYDKSILDSCSWNILRYVPGMRNLQSMCVDIGPKTDPDILKKLDSMPKTLSSLKTVNIHWMQNMYLEPKIPFSQFFENKNILKHLTHINLAGAFENNLSDTFELLPRYCQSLIEISLNFCQNKANVKILKSLKGFSKLKNIVIRSVDPLSFTENLTLPTSAKDLCVELTGPSWKKISQELISVMQYQESQEDELTYSSRLAYFFEEWRNLYNLGSLRLSVKCTPSEISTVLSFVSMILRNIPSLVKFDFTLRHSEHGCYDMDTLSLMTIFGALLKFSGRLQRIYLNLPSSFFLVWRSNRDITFPKLTELMLPSCPIFDLESIQNVFSVVSQNKIEISLGRYTINSNQDLLDLLQIIRKPPRNSKIKLKVEIQKLDLMMFDKMFEEFIGRIQKIPIVRNSSLTVEIEEVLYDKGVEALGFLKEMFETVVFYKVKKN